MAAAGKIVDNRAIRAVIAGAGFRQRQQVAAHTLQFADVPLDIGHFLQRPSFDVGTMPRRIVKQKDQFTTLLKIKPNLPRLAQ